MKTKEQATKKGKALLKRMVGDGWKLRVWENLGWHFSVSLLNLTIFDDCGNDYSAFLTTDESHRGSGEMFWSPGKSFADPNKAVKYQLKIAQDFTNVCQKTISAITAKIN